MCVIRLNDKAFVTEEIEIIIISEHNLKVQFLF